MAGLALRVIMRNLFYRSPVGIVTRRAGDAPVGEVVAFAAGQPIELVADIGRANNVILRNHGLLTMGETVAAAFVRMYWLQRACEVQAIAQASRGELLMPEKPARDKGQRNFRYDQETAEGVSRPAHGASSSTDFQYLDQVWFRCLDRRSDADEHSRKKRHA